MVSPMYNPLIFGYRFISVLLKSLTKSDKQSYLYISLNS